MKTTLYIIFIIGAFTSINAEMRREMICDVCKDVVKFVDRALTKGERIEEKLYRYCNNKCPHCLKRYCLKIDRSFKYIIRKLKDRAKPLEICKKLRLCST
ncbi:surfactant protein B [Dictyocaulus viviparus]|uniref:Surfactant protein B n=1 Tax=Dictyocaulus viviparus TaxID=29172 RepID=A0A0D8Y4G0_DICVI|nr:surfactant protein B [Dictyocaulus viviparus]